MVYRTGGSAQYVCALGGRENDKSQPTVALDTLIFSGLRELAGDEAPDFLITLVEHFLSDVPQSLEQMRQAMVRDDLSGLAHLAHRLKGSASNLGALGMARMCGQIREAVEATALERASGLPDELEREFERVRARLSQEAVGCEKIQDLGHGKRSEAA